ncbi:MAG: MerR family transcriptional regulator [Rhodobacterales bacterium]|nr:MerR family transcriptional regulator [Rhodobacterales bacterium]
MSEEPAEYTVDELATHTRVPSRTIRFYQSKGALAKPEIRGRKAFYNTTHVERLQLIGTLQDRGLSIRAIRDLVQRIDSGDLALDEWLGLEDQLHSRFSDDAPRLYTQLELDQLLDGQRPGVVHDLIRLGLLERQGDAYLAASPTLVQSMLQMEAAGIDLDIAQQAAEITRKHLGKLGAALGKHYIKHAGAGFGRTTSASDLGEAFGAARPLGQLVVHTVFGQEMEKVLRGYADSGQIAKIATKKSKV